jgi:transcriptional regulator with XRE-family HTH domain
MERRITPEIVETVRAALGVTQRELAARLGVHEATVSRWLRDDSDGREPSRPADIGALLRVSPPSIQRRILSAMGIEDVDQFAVDILVSAGVAVVDATDPVAFVESVGISL